MAQAAPQRVCLTYEPRSCHRTLMPVATCAAANTALAGLHANNWPRGDQELRWQGVRIQHGGHRPLRIQILLYSAELQIHVRRLRPLDRLSVLRHRATAATPALPAQDPSPRVPPRARRWCFLASPRAPTPRCTLPKGRRTKRRSQLTDDAATHAVLWCHLRVGVLPNCRRGPRDGGLRHFCQRRRS